jgi:hypothetical protein
VSRARPATQTRVRTLVVACVLLAAATVATQAGGERRADLRVRHGESIGKLKLGMTLPQVRQLLGRERAANKREKRGSRGYVYLELDWDFGWWTVGFIRPPRGGVYRAVSIETVQRGQRTPEGLGPGATQSQIQRRLARVNCRTVYTAQTRRLIQLECVYGGQGERQTAFVFERWGAPVPDDPAVATVAVRDPDFYRGWRVRFCPAEAAFQPVRC